MKNNELKEQQLENVAGGTSREKTITVVVDFSEYRQFTSDITIKPYLDGELLNDKVKTVDRSITVVNINITGKGIKQLRVKLNNEVFKTYKLDFTSGTVIELG